MMYCSNEYIQRLTVVKDPRTNIIIFRADCVKKEWNITDERETKIFKSKPCQMMGVMK